MAKAKDATANASSDQSEPTAGGKPSARRWKLVVSLAAVVVIASAAGGYFAFETFAASEHQSPTVAAAAQSAMPSGPMPVALVDASTRQAADYQIVAVFDGEAILATPDTLIRVKVGSLAPGLGTITSVDAAETGGGGSVVGTEATLRAL